jgi:hypothetical protein
MNFDNLFERCINSITYLHDGVSSAYQHAGFSPKTDSIATKEIAATKKREILITAYSQGAMLIEVAADEAMAFAKTLINPALTIAPWSIARSVIEASALGCWLMDIKIDEMQRIARSYAFRYEGLIQQLKYAKSQNQVKLVQSIEERIKKVECQAIALGYPPIHSKNNKCIGIAQLMPSITEIVDQILHKQATYRLLSAAVHAHFWAIKNLGFEMVPDADVPTGANNVSGVNVHFMHKALKPLSILAVTSEVITSFARIIWNRFLLFGWDKDNLLNILESVYDQLEMKQRFWRVP